MNLCSSIDQAKLMWCTPKAQTAAIAAVTFRPGATGKELVKSLVTFSKAGKGWQKYCKGRWERVSAPSIKYPGSDVVTFKGEVVLHLLGQHDIVILQHWPPVELVKLIKEAGAKKVLLWTDFESLPMHQEWGNGHWAPASNPMDIAQLRNLLFDDNVRFGWTTMDNEYVGAWLPCFKNAWDTQGYDDVVEGLFFDNVLTRPYTPGISILTSGYPDYVSRYKATWHRLLKHMTDFTEVWGNTTMHNPYELHMPYVEHLFKFQEWPEIILSKPPKLFIGLVESIGKTYVDHPEYLELLRRNLPRSTELVIQTMRSDAWLFHL